MNTHCDSAGRGWGLATFFFFLKAPQVSGMCSYITQLKSWTLSIFSSLGSFIHGGFFILIWPRIYFPMLQKKWDWAGWTRSRSRPRAIPAALPAPREQRPREPGQDPPPSLTPSPSPSISLCYIKGSEAWVRVHAPWGKMPQMRRV